MRINAALLKISISLADYVSLRQKDSVDTWARRIMGTDEDVVRQLGDAANWVWWEKIVRHSHLGLKDFTVEPRLIQDPFYGFNYLFDEALYAHLHQLAVAGRIWASVADLGNANQLESVLQAIAAAGFPLGIVDGSNVLDPAWLGCIGTAAYIRKIRPYAVPDTLFLNTVDYPRTSCNWSYVAFTSEYLETYTSVESLGDIIQQARGVLQVPELRSVLNEVDLPVPYKELSPHHKRRPGEFQPSGLLVP